MRESRKGAYPRKLSTLASKESGVHIQKQRRGPMTLLGKGGDGAAPFPADNAIVSHSSVEDNAAALRLYWHRSVEWERSLGYPLRTQQDDARRGRRQAPLRMYLDGCNLPIGCRGINFCANHGDDDDRGGGNPGDKSGVKRDNGNYKDLRIATTNTSADFHLTSRVRSSGDNRYNT
jgi:hypothetical protein